MTADSTEAQKEAPKPIAHVSADSTEAHDEKPKAEIKDENITLAPLGKDESLAMTEDPYDYCSVPHPNDDELIAAKAELNKAQIGYMKKMTDKGAQDRLEKAKNHLHQELHYHGPCNQNLVSAETEAALMAPNATAANSTKALGDTKNSTAPANKSLL